MTNEAVAMLGEHSINQISQTVKEKGPKGMGYGRYWLDEDGDDDNEDGKDRDAVPGDGGEEVHVRYMGSRAIITERRHVTVTIISAL